MDHLQRVHPGSESPAGDVEMGYQAADIPAVNQRHLGWHRPNPWAGNDPNTLLVVATLITTLSYQIGTSLPGGYWQDTKMQDGKVLYRAGDPIMRDLQNSRYMRAYLPIDQIDRLLGVLGTVIFTGHVAPAGTGCSWWRAGLAW
jgi:hypothetical protein